MSLRDIVTRMKLFIRGKEVEGVELREETITREPAVSEESYFSPLPPVRSESATLTLGEVKVRPAFLEGLGLSAEGFDVIVKNVVTNPKARPLRSKKKRLRKKWAKKNTQVVNERTYRNCFIQGIEER